jgi:hypothetical protein
VGSDMEDKSKKKAKFTEEDIRKGLRNMGDSERTGVFIDFIEGDSENLSDILIGEIVKKKEMKEKLLKIMIERHKEYREKFFELSFSDKVNFIIDNQFWAYTLTILCRYNIIAGQEGEMDSEEYREAMLKKLNDDLDKDLKLFVDSIFLKRKENKEDKINSE